MERVKTGIKNLDFLIEGGIPKGSNILLSGEPGSGKTIFCLEFLYRGALEFGENGLYISLEQKENDLTEQAECLGFDFKKMQKQKKISIFYIPVDKIGRDIAEKIKAKAFEAKAKRIVFDSLSLLALNPLFLQDKKFSLADGDELKVAFNTPHFIYSFIHLLEEINATFLITKNTYDVGDDDAVSEFVCDGVIHLRSTSMGKIQKRTLEIKKMRKTDCSGGVYSLKILKGGLVVG